jgi:spore germination protein YaaH
VQAVDEFQLMTYDFSWGGSAPGPSTPLYWLKEVLDHVDALDSEGVWNKADVLIGNAGYGRRWALGEDRLGSTLDYKQLMTVQNGQFIHNAGSSVLSADGTHKEFHFNDQDFIPITGFNDAESDYQVTYLGVYDRFMLTENGGATYSYTNRPAGANYVTNYSRKPFPIFSNVIAYDFNGVSNFNSVDGALNGEGTQVSRFYSIDKDKGIYGDTLYVADRVTGLPDLGGVDDMDNALVHYGYAPDFSTGTAPSENGKVTYTLNATGTYKLIALVNFPFFDQAELKYSFNGGAIQKIDGNNVDWYPFMQAQEKHFVNLGTFTFSGTNTIDVTASLVGAEIWGFVVVEDFNYNLRGGTMDFPVSTQPMLTRDPNNGDLKVEAEFPEFMRMVGEVLRRPPRPAIIWEDIFNSYGAGVAKDIMGFRYYPLATNPKNIGFSQGNFLAYKAFDTVNDMNPDDYSHVKVDSRLNEDGGQGSAQLVLNRKFATDIAVEIECVPDISDTKALYGIRVLAPTAGKTGDGYLCLLDWDKEEVRIVYERNAIEDTTVVVAVPVPMTDSLKALRGSRIKLRAYVKDGKISFFVNDRAYFDRVQLPDSATFDVPTNGAYGFWTKYCRMKLYKLNISSMERYERMERLMVEVDGDPDSPYIFDEVARDTTTYPIDEYDFIQYNGYPAELAGSLPNPTDEGDGGGEANTATNTVIDTQINTSYAWSNDYKSKALAVVKSFKDKRNVKVTMIDGGIWMRSFFVGDNQGMSVAYNSDKVGFIKTANFVADYGCKGIALWTLGQEDPTVYTYIPDADNI